MKDINSYVAEFRKNSGIILLDVRNIDEYNEAKINGSINLPLDKIDTVEEIIPDKNAKIYVYCRSGRRSGIAADAMADMGYTDVTNIGGILDYKEETEA